jgi:exodeoxyribonuclease VIII
MITINSISFSKLKALNHSPKRLHQYITAPQDTDAMTAGSVLDCLLFTPDEFSDKFAIAPDVDRRTKDGKALYAEFWKTPTDGPS